MYSSSVLLPEECEYKIIIIIINVLNTQKMEIHYSGGVGRVQRSRKFCRGGGFRSSPTMSILVIINFNFMDLHTQIDYKE